MDGGTIWETIQIASKIRTGRDTVSVVIPTRNRPESLMRLLDALARQTYPLREIIIVDAGTPELDTRMVSNRFSGERVRVLHTLPSVCHQRNTGIRAAAAQWIFLCDDDMEPPPNYVAGLMDFLAAHPDAGAVSGLFHCQNSQGRWQPDFHPQSARAIFWNWLFQLSIWCPLEQVWQNRRREFSLKLIRRTYLHNPNRLSLAGWPVLTNFRKPFVAAPIYSLGAAIVRKEWLLAAPFDTILDEHGIGDNFGVIARFPQKNPIYIRTDVPVYHHRASDNRLDSATVYFRRILALHYFLSTNLRFSRMNRLMLLWSLLGNLLSQIFGSDWRKFRITLEALKTIVTGRNPYLRARKEKPYGPVNPVPGR